MNIFGIDCSTSSPAVCCLMLDDNFDVIDVKALCFTKLPKKYRIFVQDKNIRYIEIPDSVYTNYYARVRFLTKEIYSFYKRYKPQYFAVEDYAVSRQGRLTSLAEICGLIKWGLLDSGSILRVYEIITIKKFFTKNIGYNHGKKIGIDKNVMLEAWNKMEKRPFNLNTLPALTVSGNPKDDIVDSYAIAEMLRQELKYANGLPYSENLHELIHGKEYKPYNFIKL